MSADRKDDGDNNSTMCCAGCGIAGVDDVKLKRCACKLVQYCGIECQREHRPKHKKECKKRIVELRDELLFKQPESSCMGDCPICCLPLPIDHKQLCLMPCCGHCICQGCYYANQKREKERRLEHKCPFCRVTFDLKSQKNSESNLMKRVEANSKSERQMMKRVEANDPFVTGQMGYRLNQAGDHSGAIEYWTKAAGLGDMHSHFNLSVKYKLGQGVDKDEKKYLYHSEQAAIGGHPHARHNLGCFEEENGRMDRAVKHWIIAANMGQDHALDALKKSYRDGLVSKEDFAAALRAHQAAVDATKSPQRDIAVSIANGSFKGSQAERRR